MTDKSRFTTCFIFSLMLAYLSPPPLASAWSHPDSAHSIKLEETQSFSITDIGEKQYRKFYLGAAGNISVVFTHNEPEGLNPSSEAAWEIKLQDRELFNDNKSYIFKTSAQTDKGVTCSQWLRKEEGGEYYLLVKGVDGSILPTNITYYVTVSQQTKNVKLQQGGAESYHLTITDAYGAATGACTIRPTCAGFSGVVQIDKDFAVTIDGGQDCCLDQNEKGYTIIHGALNVTRGKVIAKGLKVY